MDFMTRSWHEPKSDSNCIWGYDRYMQAWLKGGPLYDGFIRDLDEWAVHPDTMTQIRSLQDSLDVDGYWDFLQAGLREHAEIYFTRHPGQTRRGEDTSTARLRENYKEARARFQAADHVTQEMRDT
eukprot:4741907-Pyramimonas_sp.AAC.1